MRRINLQGKKFDLWTVVGQPIGIRRKTTGKIELHWPCVCQCGTGKDNPVYVVSHNLKSHASKSCGCLREEKIYHGTKSVRNNNTKEKLMEKINKPFVSSEPVKASPSQYCNICGKKLNSYNKTGKCLSTCKPQGYQYAIAH